VPVTPKRAYETHWLVREKREMALIREGEGVPDFVLLEELTEDALYKNLALRYKKNQIYT
jgi:myosin heavy subunit